MRQMPDLARTLADLGAAIGPMLWAPALAWTALVLLAEAILWRSRFSPSVGLWARGSLLAVLPALLILPPLLAPWVPSFAATEALAPVAMASPLAIGAAAVSPEAASGAVSPAEFALGVGVVLAILLAIAAVFILCGSLILLRRVRRSLQEAEAAIQNEARALSGRVGVSRPVRIATASRVSCPFTMGWRRPLIAVPDGLDGEPLQFALVHELAHIRHAHYGWHLAERALRAVFVWHPLVHVLARGLALDRERVADQAVLRLWPGRAEAYGRLLLAFASRPAPALSLGTASPPLLHRLAAMTHPRTDRRWAARLAGLALFVVPLVLTAASVPDAPPEPLAPEAPQASEVSPRDTLYQHVWRAEVRYDNGERSIRILLSPGTSEALATTIAEYYSDGEEAGTLEVAGEGFTLRRPTLRGDAFPPPPPSPPPPGDAPLAPEAPPPPPPGPEGVHLGSAHSTGVDFNTLAPESQTALARVISLLPQPLQSSDATSGKIRLLYLTEADGSPRRC